MKIIVPICGFDRPIFVTVIASPVTIPGFEEFQFVVHRVVHRGTVKRTFDGAAPLYRQMRSGLWCVSGLPSGCRVPGSKAPTKQLAVKYAEEFLREVGVETTRKSFDEAHRLLVGKHAHVR